MTRYVARRLLALVPTWVVIGVVAFLLIHLAPGDPAAVLVGFEGLENLETVRGRLGLDQPLSVQLVTWIGNALHGDLGDSYFLGRPVTDAIVERLSVTLSLATLAMAFALLIGVPLGVLAALRPNTWIDSAVMSLALLGLSVPEFVTGLFLMLLLSVELGWLPSGGYAGLQAGFGEWFKHLLMPAFALGFMQAALIARMARSSMLEVLTSDYIRTALAKGLMRWVVIWKHAFRNAVMPVLTVAGMAFALLLSGAFITEVLFRIPGAGNLIISAVERRDYPIVQGGLLVFSTGVLLINLLVDLLYAVLDPRIRYE